MNTNFLKLACLFVLYFLQAMPFGFQSRYLPIVMRRSGLSLTSLGLYKLLLLPWILKFFISVFIVDAYKTKNFWFMKSMQSFIIGSFLGAYFNQLDQTPYIIFFLNCVSAFQDICVDWFAINILKEEDLGLGNTIQVVAFKLGTLFSGGVLVYLIDYTTVSINFIIMGLIYLVCYLLVKTVSSKSIDINDSSGKTQEEEKATNLTIKEKFYILHTSPATYWMCIFVFIYKLGSIFGEQSALNMLPLFLVDLKVASAEIGLWNGIIGQTASIVGSLLAGILLKRYSKTTPNYVWIKYLIWIRIFPVALLTLLINTHETSGSHSLDNATFYLLIITSIAQLFISGFLTTLTFTLMMQVSFLSSKSIQATHFSLLSTCEVLGKLIVQPVVSAYTDQFGYSAGFTLFTGLYILSFLTFQFCPVKYLNKKHS